MIQFVILSLISLSTAFPDPSKLPIRDAIPDPLISFNNTKITTREEWESYRLPELESLFLYYEYGFAPDEKLNYHNVSLVDKNFLGGKATLKIVDLKLGPNNERDVQVMVVIPNSRKYPSPAFVGLNFCGNHELSTEPIIPLTLYWMQSTCPGVVDNKATDAGRGKQVDVWGLEQTIDRGYALVTAYYGDIEPDRNNSIDGVRSDYERAFPGKYTWGAISAWAWGLSRIVDYIELDSDIDSTKLAVVGHSRLGKTALLSGFLDKRYSLMVPSEAGQGGTAPARTNIGETLLDINTHFPYWFTPLFHDFNDQVARLPYDHNCLISACAPRPVLVLSAQNDTWGNPEGQFEMVKSARDAYLLMGTDGFNAETLPPLNEMIKSTLGYVIVPGIHSMTTWDWHFYLDFADIHLLKK